MKRPKEVEYLLVDGYNVIHAWKPLKAAAAYSLAVARDKLVHIMQNYRGFKNVAGRRFEVIVVFDAHKVEGGKGEVEHTGGVTVVYTKEAETADAYIEKSSRLLVREYGVTVATSDNLEQIIIMGAGARRLSANDLRVDVAEAERGIRKTLSSIKPIKNNPLFDNLDEETAKMMERLRNGENLTGDGR